MGNRKIGIELLRCFSLWGVILFHTMGFLDDHHLVDGSPIVLAIYKFSVYFVGIAVPLFMFISGYLYRPVDKHEIIPFIRKKALRLLLPYFVFSSLIMLSGGFFSIKELFQGFWHLWFLLALFWCFIFSMFIDYTKKYAFGVLLCAFVMGGVKVELPGLIKDFVQWYYFFALGAIIREHTQVFEYIKQYYLWIPMMLCYVITVSIVPFQYRSPSAIYELAISAIVVVLFLFAESLTKKWEAKDLIKKSILSIGRYSMGIYILHFWILVYLLSTTAIRVFHIEAFIQRIPVLTISGLVIVNFFLCYILTTLISRNKIGKLLLG